MTFQYANSELLAGGSVPGTTEVLLCTYNGSAYVIRQLESIINQTLPIDRISIFDDVSSDGTASVIENYVKTLPVDKQDRIQISKNSKNLGYARNFTQAIERAQGDLLFLCDQDDVWEAEKVATLCGLVAVHDVDLAFSDGRPIDEFGNLIPGGTVLEHYGLSATEIPGFHQEAWPRLVQRNYINGAALVMRRSAAQSALPLPCDMPHDYWLAIRCALGRGIRATPLPLYRYRQHGSNQIGLGAGPLRYQIAGIWRHHSAPRNRELRIWRSMLPRIAELASPCDLRLAEDKLSWLESIVPRTQPVLTRSRHILRSCVDGSYRRYSPGSAIWRDIAALFRSHSSDD